jgi:hypothetical protein
MYKQKKIAYFFLCIALSLNATSQDAIDLKSIQKEISKTDKLLAAEFAAVKLVPYKVFFLQEFDGHDSLSFYFSEKFKTDSFYMLTYEVTNMQYRQFIESVQDSILKKLLGYVKVGPDGNEYLDQAKKLNIHKAFESMQNINGGDHFISRGRIDTNGLLKPKYLVYAYDQGKKRIQVLVMPDTAYWKNNYPIADNGSVSSNDFYNPAFDTYPVAGVNFSQADAYCHWKTKQIKNALSNNMKFDIVVQPNANQLYYPSAQQGAIGFRYVVLFKRKMK